MFAINYYRRAAPPPELADDGTVTVRLVEFGTPQAIEGDILEPAGTEVWDSRALNEAVTAAAGMPVHAGFGGPALGNVAALDGRTATMSIELSPTGSIETYAATRRGEAGLVWAWRPTRAVRTDDEGLAHVTAVRLLDVVLLPVAPTMYGLTARAFIDRCRAAGIADELAGELTRPSHDVRAQAIKLREELAAMRGAA